MDPIKQSYLDGISEGRAILKSEGLAHAHEHLDNLNRTITGFAPDSEVGQFLRGERDFWRNQIKKHGL